MLVRCARQSGGVAATAQPPHRGAGGRSTRRRLERGAGGDHVVDDQDPPAGTWTGAERRPVSRLPADPVCGPAWLPHESRGRHAELAGDLRAISSA